MFNLLKKGISELKEKIFGTVKSNEKKESKEKEVIVKVKRPFSISKKVKLDKRKIAEILEEFELKLISADVSVNTAEEIAKKIETRLVEKEFNKQNLEKEINKILKDVIFEELNIKNDFWDRCNEKPSKILFLGPNGHGKTTAIAKVAYMLKQKGYSVVLAAADTFRAAAIEQLSFHANRLSIKLVKGKYGSDPTAVAFDAVNSANSHNTDFVLIDTAGRLETNFNLLQELKKMDRVIKPTLKIFVAEALAGNNLIESAKKFDTIIGIDGFILTKVDCDVKGGTALSLISEFQKPIYFLGIGQDYKDLIEFSPSFIISKLWC